MANLNHEVNGINPSFKNLEVRLLNCLNNKGFSLYTVSLVVEYNCFEVLAISLLAGIKIKAAVINSVTPAVTDDAMVNLLSCSFLIGKTA